MDIFRRNKCRGNYMIAFGFHSYDKSMLESISTLDHWNSNKSCMLGRNWYKVVHGPCIEIFNSKSRILYAWLGQWLLKLNNLQWTIEFGFLLGQITDRMMCIMLCIMSFGVFILFSHFRRGWHGYLISSLNSFCHMPLTLSHVIWVLKFFFLWLIWCVISPLNTYLIWFQIQMSNNIATIDNKLM